MNTLGWMVRVAFGPQASTRGHGILKAIRRWLLVVFFCTLPLISFLPMAGTLYRVGSALWQAIDTPAIDLKRLAAAQRVQWQTLSDSDLSGEGDGDGDGNAGGVARAPACGVQARIFLSATVFSQYPAAVDRLRRCGYAVGVWQDARPTVTGWNGWVNLRRLVEMDLRSSRASRPAIDGVLRVDRAGSWADVWIVDSSGEQRAGSSAAAPFHHGGGGDAPSPAWQAGKTFLDITDAVWPWILVTFHTLLGTVACYGIAMLAFAKLRRKGRVKPMSDPDGWPSLSVLVPAYNEENVIVATVRSLVASRYPGTLEIIVIDDGSRDDTWAVTTRHFAGEPLVRVLRKPNGGKATALNLGLAHAVGEIVAVIDADTLLHAHALHYLAANFVRPEVAAVSGNMQVGNEANEWTRLQSAEYACANNIERRAQEYLGCITVVPGAIGAYRRSVLHTLGGYEQDTLAEDADLTVRILRAGWKIVFEERALARTEAPQNLSDFMKQRFRWSFGKLQVVWKHRAALFARDVPRLGWIGLPMLVTFNFVLPLFVLVIGWVQLMALLVLCLQPTWTANLSLLAPVDLPVAVLIAELLAPSLFARLTRGVARAMDKKIPGSLVRPPFCLRTVVDALREIPVRRLMKCILIYLVYKSFVRMQSRKKTAWNKLQRMASVTADFNG